MLEADKAWEKLLGTEATVSLLGERHRSLSMFMVTYLSTVFNYKKCQICSPSDATSDVIRQGIPPCMRR